MNISYGINVVNYDAPLAIYFYGSPYCDPADPIIAATYAMIAAEALGLGTCMLGAIHPLIQYGKSAQAEEISMVVRRFIDSGMTEQETAIRMDVSIEYVQKCLKK